jgi:hypothetical protein
MTTSQAALPIAALPVAAMLAGFLVQNAAEWYGNGPKPPTTGPFRHLFPKTSESIRRLALIFVSVLVLLICAIALALGVNWPLVAIAAALVVNAVSQLLASLITRTRQPGTIAGLIFMLPPSLWVINTVATPKAWVPILAGPVLSFPVLIAVWWLAAFAARHQD